MLPKRFPDREEINAVRVEAEKAESGETLEQVHRVAGRVMARREMGKLAFLDLVDRSGRIQLIVREKVGVDLGDVPELAGNADAIRDLAALRGREVLDLLLELLVAFLSENDVLHRAS